MEYYRRKKFKYLKKNIQSDIEENKILKLLKIEEKKLIKSKDCVKIENIKSIINKSESDIKIIRKKNYNYLKKKLKNQNFNLSFKSKEVPLFFILKFSSMKTRNNLRNILKKNKIFCPVFWEIKTQKLNSFPYSKFLSQNTLAIPIDHRITISDTKHIVKIIKKYDN